MEKKVSPDSDTEVVLSLTEDGQINYQTHQAYHQEGNDTAQKLLEEMPDALYTSMVAYLTAFEASIDEKLKE